MEQQGAAVDVIRRCEKAERWTLAEGEKGPPPTYPAALFCLSSQEMAEDALSSPLNSNCTPPASADSYMLRRHAKQITQALSELPRLFGNHPT